MNDSLIGVLLVCGLALFATAWLAFACATAARDLRCRRRRSRLHVVAGAGSVARRGQPDRSRTVRPVLARRSAPLRSPWDSVPVTQWEPPREREPDSGPSPAA